MCRGRWRRVCLASTADLGTARVRSHWSRRLRNSARDVAPSFPSAVAGHARTCHSFRAWQYPRHAYPHAYPRHAPPRASVRADLLLPGQSQHPRLLLAAPPRLLLAAPPGCSWQHACTPTCVYEAHERILFVGRGCDGAAHHGGRSQALQEQLQRARQLLAACGNEQGRAAEAPSEEFSTLCHLPCSTGFQRYLRYFILEGVAFCGGGAYPAFWGAARKEQAPPARLFQTQQCLMTQELGAAVKTVNLDSCPG